MPPLPPSPPPPSAYLAPRLRAAFLAALGLCFLPWMAGCKRDDAHAGGCLSGAPGCRLPTPCPELAFSCPGGDALRVERLTAGNVGTAPGGSWDELASIDDVLISNGRATAVIAALGTQNYLDPNGGSILDLSSRSGGVSDDNDAINDIYQVAGILPRDALHYTQMELIDESPTRVAVQLLGTLDDPKVGGRVATLYEMRPCEPGIRVRTELVNEGMDPQLWFLSDTWYWSKNEPLPFAPYPGGGFTHPGFGLTTINDAFRSFPFMSSSQHSAPYASYSEVACNQPSMEGVNSDQVSAVGMMRTIVQPRELMVFERFIAVTGDDDAAGATDVVLEARRQLFGEHPVSVSGTVQRVGALSLGTEREVSILISEGTAATPAEQRVPWTQVVPDGAGNFSARVPAGKTYVLTALSFGEKQAEVDLGAVDADTVVPAIALPSTARVNLTVTLGGGPLISAHVFFIPADEATRQATTGNFHGVTGSCAPWLGPPAGSSPACNRVLSSDQVPVVLEVPAGTYDVYAFKGPFHTIARSRDLVLTPANHNVHLDLIALQRPAGDPLSADLHVHGAASFDSSIPEQDRVRSFDASGLDVIVATDHDVVYDYGATVEALGFADRMSAVVGLETTGHIPFLYVPGYGYPLVIGHYNFWPLRFDSTLPRNGGPFDDYLEPGELMDRMAPLYTSPVPIAQLNHPWAPSQFGRDLGFPRAIMLDARQDLPADDDGTRNGVYVRRPPGASRRNDEHTSQEVMNGTENDALLEYRAFWWYTLNQGQRKVGTANSDSHSLADSIVGLPRNMVYASTAAGRGFDVSTFNQAVADGRVLGTGGPLIEAEIPLQSGGRASYGTQLVTNPTGTLEVRVSAAPWVPLEEVRFVVNGKVVKTIDGAQVQKPADPFAAAWVSRYDGLVQLSELLAGVSGDAWIVVEAGGKLPLAGDLGGGLNGEADGIPDTTDNNGDGVVDRQDVSPSTASSGPMVRPPLPTDRDDPAYHYSAITGSRPMAFTNPFFLDRNGNGVFDAPTVKGGR